MSSNPPSKRSAQRCAPVAGIDELPGDAHSVPGLAHAAFEHIAHAQFAPDLLHIDGPALVGEARIARDHEQPAHARQGGDDLLDHAVGEIFLLGIAAHVLERQDGNRGLVGKRQRVLASRFDRGVRSRFGRHHSKGGDRLGDVLHPLVAHWLEGEGDRLLNLLRHLARYANAAGGRELLQPSRDIDAFAVPVLAFDDHFPKVDADADLDALFRFDPGIAFRHAALHGHRAFDRIDHAAEFGEKPIAHELEDAAVMLLDLGLEEFFAVGPQPVECSRFVLLHKRRVADDVSREDSG